MSIGRVAASLLIVPTLVGVVVAIVASPSQDAPVIEEITLEPAPSESWRLTLRRATSHAARSAFEAQMIVVGLGDDGPVLSEVSLGHGADGELRVEQAEAWIVAREHEESYFGAAGGGWLRMGPVEQLQLGLDEAVAKYRIEVAGRAALQTGPALAIGFFQRTTGLLRERVYVDDRTGITVRRETFAADGMPARVVALTDLRVDDIAMEALEGRAGLDGAEELGPRTDLSARGLAILDATGWDLPAQLPDGFLLRGSYALPAPEAGAVHLVYSDGLYTLSLYEQRGTMATEAMAGATAVDLAGMHVYRWPGAQPERLVWTGAGSTFTAVTDAPLDAVTAAIAVLPSDPADGVGRRVGRGLARVGSWLWPFG